MAGPLFSIITLVNTLSVRELKRSLHYMRLQTCRNWEWLVLLHPALSPASKDSMRRNICRDDRVKFLDIVDQASTADLYNVGFSAAQGDWITFLNPGDFFSTDALNQLENTIDAHSLAGYIYSDEETLNIAGSDSVSFRKPAWSPERLRHEMYLGDMSAMRADILRMAGGFVGDIGGNAEHDLALRVTELCEEVVHIPSILYHRNSHVEPNSLANVTNLRTMPADPSVVDSHLKRMGLGESMRAYPHRELEHAYSIQRSLPNDATISVIIPTRGSDSIVWGMKRNLVVNTVRSVLRHTTREVEIVIIYDADTPSYTIDHLKRLGGHNLKLVPYSHPFNYSEKCNLGFCASSGEFIVLLNDDLEIQTDDFLDQLCAPLIESSVGITGARLLYSDTTIQHAGVAIDKTTFFHTYLGEPSMSPGYMGELKLDHEVSAVTGAALALSRETYLAVGGLTEHLPVNFNDVDLCLKVRHLGKRVVALSNVEAFHFESQTRTPIVEQFEIDFITSRWDGSAPDPYFRIDPTHVQ